MSLMKPLTSYEFFKEMIITRYWNSRKKFFLQCFFLYPRLNQSLKWRFDYIIVANNKFKGKRKCGSTFR